MKVRRTKYTTMNSTVSTYTQYHRRNYLKHQTHHLNRAKIYYQDNKENIKAKRRERYAVAKAAKESEMNL
jgi:hypothetical protein